jgi:hypothetical protein
MAKVGGRGVGAGGAVSAGARGYCPDFDYDYEGCDRYANAAKF